MPLSLGNVNESNPGQKELDVPDFDQSQIHLSKVVDFEQNLGNSSQTPASVSWTKNLGS